MANKPQTKAAINNLVAIVFNDIDTTLPAGVNIQDAELFPKPNTWTLYMLTANGNEAETVSTFITDQLTLQGRSYDIEVLRRKHDGVRHIDIRSTTGRYIVTF